MSAPDPERTWAGLKSRSAAACRRCGRSKTPRLIQPLRPCNQALPEWHFAAQRWRFTPSFGLRLPRRNGEEQIAGRRSLDPEVAPRNLDLLLLAPGEARRKRVCGVHTGGRARGGPRARRAEQRDAVPADALLHRRRDRAVEHVRRQRMAAHVKCDAISKVVVAGEHLERTVGGRAPQLLDWLDQHRGKGSVGCRSRAMNAEGDRRSKRHHTSGSKTASARTRTALRRLMTMSGEDSSMTGRRVHADMVQSETKRIQVKIAMSG